MTDLDPCRQCSAPSVVRLNGVDYCLRCFELEMRQIGGTVRELLRGDEDGEGGWFGDG